jgi:hypothetical protein
MSENDIKAVIVYEGEVHQAFEALFIVIIVVIVNDVANSNLIYSVLATDKKLYQVCKVDVGLPSITV